MNPRESAHGLSHGTDRYEARNKSHYRRSYEPLMNLQCDRITARQHHIKSISRHNLLWTQKNTFSANVEVHIWRLLLSIPEIFGSNDANLSRCHFPFLPKRYFNFVYLSFEIFLTSPQKFLHDSGKFWSIDQGLRKSIIIKFLLQSHYCCVIKWNISCIFLQFKWSVV